MMGGGVWDPPAESLKKIRQEIDYNGAGLKKIINAKDFLKYSEKYPEINFRGIRKDMTRTTPILS